MKRIVSIIALALLLVGIDSASAQSRTSYFMEGSYFRTELNPALVPTRGYLIVPGVSATAASINSNFLSIDNFFYKRDGGVVTALHSSVSADEYLSKLPSVGKETVDARVALFGVGFYAKKMFWSFGIDTRASMDAAMSMDLFKAVKTLGNGTYDLSATACEFNTYADIYLGTSFRVHENVSLGIKAKFLVGIATLDMSLNEGAIRVAPDEVKAYMGGTWRANGAIIDEDAKTQSGARALLSDMLLFDPVYIFKNIKTYGFAIDLGTEVRLLDDHLKLSLAVTDLGFIKWDGKNRVGGYIGGHFGFNGVNLETSKMETDSDFNFNVDEVPNSNGYTTMLNCSVNAGVEYNFLGNHMAVGLLSHNRFCKTMFYSDITASLNLRPTNWLSATLSHTFLNHNRLGVFGFALNIHPAVVNMFVGVDFIDTRWVNSSDADPIFGIKINAVPRYQSSFNIYMGIGFNFGRPEHLRKSKKMKKEDDAMVVAAPYESALATIAPERAAVVMPLQEETPYTEVVESIVEVEPEVMVEVETEIAVETEVEPETVIETVAEVEPEVMGEVEPETVIETVTEVEANSETEVAVEAAAEIEVEAEMEIESAA